MRVLVLLQGIPGSGKSTLVEKMGWGPHTISTDNLRLLHGGPIMNEDGTLEIDQNLSGKAWNLLFTLLEDRMKQGEFTVVDATHCNKETLNKYRGLTDKYRYRTYIIRANCTVEQAVENDRMRPAYKQVGATVINRMFQQLQSANAGWAELINSEDTETIISKLHYLPEDLTYKYKSIVHFGDLQGCVEPIKRYFMQFPMDDQKLYVFTGDLVDRGIQNDEVVKLLLSLYKKPNVILVEGNHEHHLNCWANNEEIVSEEFELRTKPQLEAAGISKKEVRDLYRRSRQILYYLFHGKEVFVSHGGVPVIPNPRAIIEIPTKQYIKGVGKYEIDIDEVFEQKSGKNQYQVHGHRNAHMRPLLDTQRSFNLEGGVEFGGHFRVAELDADGWKVMEIQNNVFNINQERGHHPNIELNENNMLVLLRGNKNINEKSMGNNISSFNFNRDTFYEGLWNAQSIKARGLFINTKTNKIVARSYEKFFNIGEMEFTQIDRLKSDMKYPVKFYEKENGFLGILGYDPESDQLIIASKSSTKSDFARYFKEILSQCVDLNYLKDWISDKNFSLVFEVIDPKRDPHIIEYQESCLYLLDVIYNEIKFNKAPDEYRSHVARRFGFLDKKHYATVYTPEGLEELIKELKATDKGLTEGYVLEDSAGFMTKLKLPEYGFWKYMRGMKGRMIDNPNFTVHTDDIRVYEFVEFLKTLPQESLKLDIITLRKQFYARKSET
jgi:predicted kinase